MKLRLIFRFIAEYSSALIWFLDAEGKQIYANKTALDYLGVSFEELLARGWVEFIHPEQLPATLAVYENNFRLKSHFEFETRIRRHDGVYHWFIGMGGPVLDSKGECIGFVGSSVDIHERKLAEEALVQYAQRLEQSNKELEHFAAIASHDLQEPLRKLMLFGDHLQKIEQDRLSPEGLDDLERMQRATTRMQRLINDLLDLSRITRQGKPFQKTDLNLVAREVIAEMSYAYPDIKARVTLIGAMTIDADPNQMHQMLYQLLDNALKFHKPDKVTHVRLEICQSEGNQCRISVTDDGIGISAEYVDKIFDTFVRLHSGVEYSGTGIGLALVKKITERHHGQLRLESTPGQGSTFTVQLPVAQEL